MGSSRQGHADAPSSEGMSTIPPRRAGIIARAIQSSSTSIEKESSQMKATTPVALIGIPIAGLEIQREKGPSISLPIKTKL
jgi:hypothetical protein